MSEQKPEGPFEAIVAVYGVPLESGDIWTVEAALSLFSKLSEQVKVKAQLPGMQGYRIVDVRIEGDEKRGKIWATFEHP